MAFLYTQAQRFFTALLLSGVHLSQTAVAAKIDELVVKVPYDINLGREANVAELSMTCTLLPENEPDYAQRAPGVVVVPETGSVRGTYSFRFERTAGVQRIDKDQHATVQSMPREFFSRFESGHPAHLNCVWRGVRHNGASQSEAWGFVDTHTKFGQNGELTVVSAGEPIFIKPAAGSSATGQAVELNSASQPFFSMTFTVADNEAPMTKVATVSSAQANSTYASLPNAGSSDSLLKLPQEISPSTSTPQSNGNSPVPKVQGNNTPVRLRVEVANICVKKSDDWGAAGDEEDVYGVFFANVTLNNKNGEAIELKDIQFVSGIRKYLAPGYLFSRSSSDAIELGENSCAGDLKQIGEFTVFPRDHGFQSQQELLDQGGLVIQTGGYLRDWDFQIFLVAPRSPRVVYEHQLDELPICGSCVDGPGTAMTGKSAVLIRKKPGQNAGVMGFALGDDPQGAFGQYHYNIERLPN